MRGPRWGTLVNVAALVVLVHHFWGIFVGPPHPPDPATSKTKERFLREDLRPLPQPGVQTREEEPFVLVSELKSTEHSWPWGDYVDKICTTKQWREPGLELPDVSVIITFHKSEHLFHLVNTLHSIIRRSPADLLREIILIDDHSKKGEFGEVLASYIYSHFGTLVRLVRNASNLGLIRARLKGIRAAKGKVVVIMDSHVEPQPGWLEPIVYQIAKDRRTLASSYIDWMIQDESGSWKYRHVASNWKTYFDWSLVFGFQMLSNEVLATRKDDPTEPVNSAVTVGNWAMDKSWFEEVGAFDEGMDRWGGENVDLSVRVWLFGGRVINVPCSHLGHVETAGLRDYRNSWSNIIDRNYKRFVEVWMDDFKKYFYLYRPNVQAMATGNLSSRYALKARAKHSFPWFLENVMPELGIPDVNVYAFGGVQGQGGLCMDTRNLEQPYVSQCDPQYQSTQGFFWTTEGLLRLPMHVILSIPDIGEIRVNEYTGYHNTGRATQWLHKKDGPIIEKTSGLCMELSTSIPKILLVKCRDTPTQRWTFRYYSKEYQKLMASDSLGPHQEKNGPHQLHNTLRGTTPKTLTKNTAAWGFLL